MEEQKFYNLNGMNLKKEWDDADFSIAQVAAYDLFPKLEFTAGHAPKTPSEMWDRMPYISSGEFAGKWVADFEAKKTTVEVRAIAISENGAPVVVRVFRWKNEKEDLFADYIDGDGINQILISRKLLKYNEEKKGLESVLTEFRKIFTKYDGKTAGAKTKEKISHELRSVCGWFVYFSHNWQLTFAHATTYMRNFKVYTRGQKDAITADNKFNASCDLYIDGMSADIVEDTEARAAQIVEAFARLKEAAQAYETARKVFNAHKMIFPNVQEVSDVNGYEHNFRD